jgi:hypothetical protein
MRQQYSITIIQVSSAVPLDQPGFAEAGLLPRGSLQVIDFASFSASNRHSGTCSG